MVCLKKKYMYVYHTFLKKESASFYYLWYVVNIKNLKIRNKNFLMSSSLLRLLRRTRQARVRHSFSDDWWGSSDLLRKIQMNKVLIILDPHSSFPSVAKGYGGHGRMTLLLFLKKLGLSFVRNDVNVFCFLL